MNTEKLNDDNFLLFAAKQYYNPLGLNYDEFLEDLNRVKYVKRLINKYLNKDDLSERLILNHLIIIFNVFGIDGSIKILEYKFQNEEYWKVLKPFLIFLKYIKYNSYPNIKMDDEVVKLLREL